MRSSRPSTTTTASFSARNWADLMLPGRVPRPGWPREEGAFDIGDVCDEICRKLIVRHPHIFSDVTASTSGEVLDNWDKIKRATKKQKSTTESMQSVSRALPSLMRAYKLGEKAAKTGFDFPDAASAADGLREELDELTEAVRIGDAQAVREETGDLLFAAVNVARKLGVDPEEALYRASDKLHRTLFGDGKGALASGTPLLVAHARTA